MSLDQLSVTAIKGVGTQLANTLAKLHIESVQDLIYHLPIRYLDRTRIRKIGELQVNSSVVIQGRVVNSQVAFGRRRSLAVKIEDDTGTVTLRFYHFSAAQKNKLAQGALIRCYGDPRLGTSGIEFYHPEYDFVDANNPPLTETSLTPIYPLTEGISQQRLRKLTKSALDLLKQYPPAELLPKEANASFHTDSLAQALCFIHFPPAEADVEQLLEGHHPYQQRLAFEELLAHFLIRQKMRLHAQQHLAPRITPDDQLLQQFVAQLPFTPTLAQQRVFTEIKNDFELNKPMLRMVQGDVGSGKTLVAALATLACVSSGYQVAIAAPTEILAEQHLASFTQWLTPLGIQVSWLVGKLTAKHRRETLHDIAEEKAQVIIGTHALFQDDVVIPKLGLAIIDEQHRFGVEQRLSLRKITRDHETPHQLVMTATPIPRTLAMTAYADLDYSVIDELPPGRTPINTVLISQQRRHQVIARIAHACAEGKQAYWVCPLVEESETLDVANAEETANCLSSQLPNTAVALIHGRIKAKEKETVMASFKKGDIQLLVATTVIEVGVDVPNASLMIIENPERLGLAQLHQLRGRVGRGQHASHCLLMYGDKVSEQGQARLKVLRETTDGFVIAEKDLQLRGPGELLGTRQTGDMHYRLADIQRDSHMIPKVHKTGLEMMHSMPQHCESLIQRWVGKSQNYAQV